MRPRERIREGAGRKDSRGSGELGINNPNLGMKDLALKVLELFKNEGLYSVTNFKGGYLITRNKISDEKYKLLKEAISKLNNNGRTEEQQNQIDEIRESDNERRENSVKFTRG